VLHKKKLFWAAFAILVLVFGVIQFVPSPAPLIPAQLPAAQREAHRLLNFQDIAYFRDLSGYQTGEGKQVKWRVPYRAGILSGSSDDDNKGLTGEDMARPENNPPE